MQKKRKIFCRTKDISNRKESGRKMIRLDDKRCIIGPMTAVSSARRQTLCLTTVYICLGALSQH